MDKKLITRVYDISLHDLDGRTFNEVRDWMIEQTDKLVDLGMVGEPKFAFDEDMSWLEYERYETDKELEQRRKITERNQKTAKARVEKKKEKELKELERLKKKYEKVLDKA